MLKMLVTLDPEVVVVVDIVVVPCVPEIVPLINKYIKLQFFGSASLKTRRASGSVTGTCLSSAGARSRFL